MLMVAPMEPAPDFRVLTAGHGLEAHFQPIASLRDQNVFGFEGLIRGPAESPWRQPLALFEAARAAGQEIAMELASARAVVESFVRQGLPGRLAINFSGACLERLAGRAERAVKFLLASGLAPGRIVIELTEHERIADPSAFKTHASELRALGLALALDDFGDGHSSLRLWAELSPEFVKIDKYFVRGIQADPARFQCVKAMIRFAEVFGTRLVAEGIESEADLHVLRDLGVELGQGYLLAHPSANPQPALTPRFLRLLQSSGISVYPEVVKMPLQQRTVAELMSAAPALDMSATNNTVIETFTLHPHAEAIAVLENLKPVGILNRHAFMDRYAQPYYRELYGKRSCRSFMNPAPIVVDGGASVEALTQILARQDQRYLADGIVVVADGRYLGIATGESLVRAVAEIRLEAARYANPLTFLPGNIPISEHIERLLASAAPFAAVYADLNQFKPFNDQYGYWRGDEMIKLAARCIGAACDPLRDFLGHVGGDDFVVMFQSPDWRERCQRIVADFNRAAPALFDPAEREAGGITAEDRHGRATFFPLTTISLGAVHVDCRAHDGAESVASAAAAAKREAKRRGAGLWVAGTQAGGE